MNITSSYQSILDAIEYDELTPEEQEAFLLELNSLIFRGAVIRTVEWMDEGTRDTWYELIAGGASEDKLRKFLEKRVPGAETALADTVETLADDILAVTTNR